MTPSDPSRHWRPLGSPSGLLPWRRTLRLGRGCSTQRAAKLTKSLLRSWRLCWPSMHGKRRQVVALVGQLRGIIAGQRLFRVGRKKEEGRRKQEEEGCTRKSTRTKRKDEDEEETEPKRRKLALLKFSLFVCVAQLGGCLQSRGHVVFGCAVRRVCCRCSKFV